MPEDLLVEDGPVVDAAVEIADVDIVEVVFGPCPLELGVVDVELAVRRYPRGLDGGDVGSDGVGAGKLVGEVSGGLDGQRGRLQG